MTGGNGRIDRRHPEVESVPRDPEAMAVVMCEAERLLPVIGIRQAAVLAFQAGLRVIRQRARRGSFFLVGEKRFEGVHPLDVRTVEDVVVRWGGGFVAAEGVRAEEVIARLIAALDASRVARAEKETKVYRHGDPRVSRTADQVAQRMAARAASQRPEAEG